MTTCKKAPLPTPAHGRANASITMSARAKISAPTTPGPIQNLTRGQSKLLRKIFPDISHSGKTSLFQNKHMKDIFHSETVAFAAGCFWGVQFYFDQIPGVLETVVGYTGGHAKNPSYEAVCTGQTGHAEAVLVSYNPNKISFEQLLRHFFRLHDP